MQGTLPTFLDIGESFSAASISEDNLLSQLQAAGKRVVREGGWKLVHSLSEAPEARRDALWWA